MFSARFKVDGITPQDGEGCVEIEGSLIETDHLVLRHARVVLDFRVGSGVELPRVGDAITINGWFSEEAPTGTNVAPDQVGVRSAEVRDAEAARAELGRCPACNNVLDALDPNPCPSCENPDKICRYCDTCTECGAHLIRDNRGQVTGHEPPPEPAEEAASTA